VPGYASHLWTLTGALSCYMAASFGRIPSEVIARAESEAVSEYRVYRKELRDLKTRSVMVK
jgi:hypothetical protein